MVGEPDDKNSGPGSIRGVFRNHGDDTLRAGGFGALRSSHIVAHCVGATVFGVHLPRVDSPLRIDLRRTPVLAVSLFVKTERISQRLLAT